MDTALFTLLFQEDGWKNGGDNSLHVLRDGKWVGEEARKEDVVVNLGYLMQFWSGGGS